MLPMRHPGEQGGRVDCEGPAGRRQVAVMGSRSAQSRFSPIPPRAIDSKTSQPGIAGTKPLDSRFRGNDGNHARRPLCHSPRSGPRFRGEGQAPRKHVLAEAGAGIQKHEQFFGTLHNTSWVRDYMGPRSAQGRPGRGSA